MVRSKFAFLVALMAVLFCGASFASELADDMTIAGNFAKGYTVNNWYSQYVTLSGGTREYTFNITEGELPPGFFIRQDNAYFYLEGIPNTAGTWKFTLRVTDRRDMYAERKLSVTIDDTNYKADDMTLSGAFTASGETGTWYESGIETNGGTAGYTFNVSGTLPPGLYISQNGGRFYLNGVPTQTGDYTFTLRVTDRRNSYTEMSSTVSITAGDNYSDPSEAEDMAITGDLPTGRRINEGYSGGVYLTGYDDGTAWSIVDGSLPPGLSLSGGRYNCTIYGIPNAGGTYRFTLRAVARRNVYIDRQFVIKINGSPFEAEDMSITDNFTTNKMINESYSSYVHLNGYTDNVTWTLAEGTLPPGLSLRSGNYYIELYGIPNTGGTYTFTLRATDSRNSYVERPFTVKINDTPFEAEDMSITGDFTTGTRINDSYYGQVNVNGYEGNVYWTLADGALPDGLSLRPSGSTAYIRGIPNKGGTYTFTLRATDSRNAYIERQFLIKINDTPYKDDGMSITGDFDTGKNVSESYYSYVSASSYAGSIYWTHVSGALPDGLSLRPDGRYAYIRGIPNKPGTYKFTLRATDTRNAYTEREFSITINGDEPSAPSSTTDMILSGVFPEGYTVNTWYSSYIQASGGESDYTFRITGGSLPPGFYIRQDGRYFYLEGIPNTAGTYTFKLRVIDKRNTYAEREFTVNINSSHYVTTDMSLAGKFPDAYTINPWYSNYVQANGGTTEYTFNITAGSLPPGFFIRQDSSYFYLEGIPSTPGTYTFSLRVTDRRNAYTERSFTMNIKGSAAPTPDPTDPVTIITSSLPNGKEGESYSASISVTGDSSIGLTWVITGLPDGLSYTTSGKTCTISGKPAAAGNYTVKVNVANTETEDTRDFTLTVDGADDDDDSQEVTFNGHKYRIYDDSMTWDEAKAYCESLGGHLVTITSQEEQNVVASLVSSGNKWAYWLGAEKSSGAFEWVTGENFSYTNFAENQPDDSGICLQMYGNHPDEEYLNYIVLGHWDDTPSDANSEKSGNLTLEHHGFICEWDSSNESDSITITTDSLKEAATGESYSQTLSADGTVTSWKITDGKLPEGLTLDESTGVISGTTSESAIEHNADNMKTYTFEVTAANASGESAVKTLAISVVEPIKFITESVLPGAVAGREYKAAITVSGTMRTNITWLVVNLPAGIEPIMPEGLTYTTNGRTCTISGTPEKAGDYVLKVSAATVDTEATQNFTLTVDPKPIPLVKPQITVPKNLGILLAGVNYSFQFTAAGTSPITWSAEGSLPPGFTFDTSTGILSGTLERTDEGKSSFLYMPYTFTVKASNRAGTDSAENGVSVWYPPEIVTASTLPEATVNSSYNETITAEGTEFSMEWKKSSGNIPAGLKLTMSKSKRSCTLTGTPTKAGTYSFALTLSNVVGLASTTTTKTFTITVNKDPGTDTGKPEITTDTLPEGETGAAYVVMLEASGQKPITWSKSGSFPKGLKLDKYGTIAGVPTKPGTYTFTLRAKNRAGTVSQKFTVTITGETYTKPKITTKKIMDAAMNQSYSVQLECTGSEPVIWSFANTKYPAGLYITEDGLIAGTPKEAGKFSLKVRADNNIGSAVKSYSLKVNGAAPSIVNEEISEATVKEEYSEQLEAEGTAPITWSKSGKFPSGLKLNTKTGEITGTPKKAGVYTFKVTAKSKYGKDTRTFTMYIWDASESTAIPENETHDSQPEITEYDSATETQNYAVTEEYSQAEIDTGVYANNSEIDMYVVSGDEELRGEIYAPEGKPLTFVIGTWPGAVKDSDIVIFIADEAVELEADDNTFTLPGELVKDEFVIYAKAGDMKTIELYVVAETEE